MDSGTDAMKLLGTENIGRRIERDWLHTDDLGRDVITCETLQDVGTGNLMMFLTAALLTFGLLLNNAHATIDATSAPYNVECDGVADDTAGILAAIDAAAAAPTGDVVQLPAGQCMHTGISMKTRVTLQGVGPQTILTAIPDASGPWVRLADGAVNHTVLRDLYIDGNRQNGAGPDGTGTCIKYTNFEDHQLIRQDEFFGFHGDPQHRIENIHIFNCSGDGANFWTRALQMRSFHISRCNNGLRVLGSDNMFVSGEIDWIFERAGIVEGGNNRFIGIKAWYIGTNANYAEGDAFLVASSRNTFVVELQDISRYAFNIRAGDFNNITAVLDNIGNLFAAQGVGYDHTGSIVSALYLDKKSDSNGASFNQIRASIGQRSAALGLDRFVSLRPAAHDNQILLTADPANLKPGGEPVSRASNTPDNLVMMNNRVM